MTIQVAVQRSYGIQLYGEHGAIIGSIAADEAAGDRLLGFTNSTVTVKRGSFINTYDEDGNLISGIGI
ncbi:MAG: hypothetical protein K6A44_06795 [bacterium]|nr:hypothetical protein [bacterium]